MKVDFRVLRYIHLKIRTIASLYTPAQNSRPKCTMYASLKAIVVDVCWEEFSVKLL